MAALLLALVLALGALAAGCGGSDESAEPAAPAPAPAEPAPAEPAPAEPAPAEPAPAEPAPAEPAPAETGPAPTGEPITIGLAIALSGPINFYDGPIEKAAQVAVDEINAAGGVLGRPLELISADMASDPAKSGAAAQELIDKGAEALILPADFDMGQGAARVASENNLISIQSAGSELSGVEGLGPLHYNIYAGTASEGAAVAQYAVDNGWKNVFLLEDPTLAYDTDLCKFFGEALETYGGTIAGKDTFQNDDPSIANQISAMQSASPDAVMVCSYLPGAAAAIKQIRDVTDIPVLTGIGQDGTFWLEGIPGASGIYISTLGSILGDDSEPQVNDFMAAYQAGTGEPAPHSLSILGYQMVKMLAHGFEGAGTTEGDKVAAVLDTVTDLDIAGTKFTYTPTCHKTPRPMTVMQIQDGTLSFAAKPEPASIPDSKC
ncbi:MAG: ABC transporter substrate-binding protein [Thermoleophilia bacterium]